MLHCKDIAPHSVVIVFVLDRLQNSQFDSSDAYFLFQFPLSILLICLLSAHNPSIGNVKESWAVIFLQGSELHIELALGVIHEDVAGSMPQVLGSHLLTLSRAYSVVISIYHQDYFLRGEGFRRFFHLQ